MKSMCLKLCFISSIITNHLLEASAPPAAESSHAIVRLTNAERNSLAAITFSKDLPPLDPKFCKHILESAPSEVKDAIDEILNPNVYSKFPKIKSNKTLILHGPSGAGKSTLARVIAQLAGKQYIIVEASMLANEYQNSAAAGLNRVGQLASETDSSILVEEIDALAQENRKRSEEQSDETPKALWRLCEIAKNKGLLFVGTTNNLENLPQQTKRRWTFCIYEIPLQASIEQRKKIIEHYIDVCPHAITKNEFFNLIQNTKKLSHGELEEITTLAIKKAIRRNQTSPVLTINDFNECMQVAKRNKTLLNKITWKKKDIFNYTIQTIGAISNLVSIASGIIAMRNNQQSLVLAQATFAANVCNSLASQRLAEQSMKQTQDIADRSHDLAEKGQSQAQRITDKADQRAADAASLQNSSLTTQKVGVGVQAGTAVAGIAIGIAVASGCTIS